MSDREYNNFVRKILIDDAERELPEDVSSEIPEVEGPALGSGPDSFYRSLDGGFKIGCSNAAAISVPA
jgi:hypothetical protein